MAAVRSLEVLGALSRATDLADAAEADPCAGLPDEGTEDDPALEVFCGRTAELGPEEAIEWARLADRTACDHDPRIRPIGSAGMRMRSQEVRLARTDGFNQSHRSTTATLFCTAIAVDDVRFAVVERQNPMGTYLGANAAPHTVFFIQHQCYNVIQIS